MRYFPHTEEDIARMLRVVGAPSLDALFAQIPDPLRAKRAIDVGAPLDERRLLGHLEELAARDRPACGRGQVSFLGGGLIPHQIPAAVDALLGRAEWYTAYTPYQPEISQGTLQAVFEYQTMVAEVLGLDVANASMYDGASATAEAVLMARRLTGRPRAVLSDGLHPSYRAVVETYLSGLGERAALLSSAPLDAAAGRTASVGDLDEQTACLVVQSPNYFGVVEDVAPLAEAARARGALVVVVTTEPLAYALLKPPGAVGADIACGEGLGLATPPSLGGPGVGLFAARGAHVRAMPGRLVGETVDKEGRRGYVLTLATREQHIRREKATSNICSNEGLVALAFTIHLSLLGKRGFRRLAEHNLALADYARQKLTALPGFAPRFSGPTFNELALRVPAGKARRAVEELAPQCLFPGVAVDEDTLLVAVSERHERADIDRLARSLAEVCR